MRHYPPGKAQRRLLSSLRSVAMAISQLNVPPVVTWLPRWKIIAHRPPKELEAGTRTSFAGNINRNIRISSPFRRLLVGASVALCSFLVPTGPVLAAIGDVISSFSAPGTKPRGLTWDGTNLWLADTNTDLIYELTTTGTVLSSFATPSIEPTGLTWDGTNLWLSDTST
ncbi:MAG: hypothetical protein V3U86_05680, partial [Acidobacteriota bacterium]